MKVLRLVFALVFICGINSAEAKNFHKKRHAKKSHVKIQKIMSPLKGSIASRLKQNKVADEEGLEKIRDDEELQNLKDSGSLIPLPSEHVLVDERLDPKNRWCRPWVREFILNELANFFGEIQINSAVRTIRDQEKLRRGKNRNYNAVSPYGPLASSHIRGSTIDITKKNLPPKLLNWLRNRLLKLEIENLIEVTEERYQPVFHVMVFKKYSEYTKELVANR